MLLNYHWKDHFEGAQTSYKGHKRPFYKVEKMIYVYLDVILEVSADGWIKEEGIIRGTQTYSAFFHCPLDILSLPTKIMPVIH